MDDQRIDKGLLLWWKSNGLATNAEMARSSASASSAVAQNRLDCLKIGRVARELL
jgi:hypothetical protein